MTDHDDHITLDDRFGEQWGQEHEDDGWQADETRAAADPIDDKADEIAWEAARDERLAEEEAAAQAAEPDDDGECHAEQVDGSWTYCGCEECDDREAGDRDDYEAEHGEGTWTA